ncbi:MAG TPA: hypothetical protein VG125_27330 [Pirellulales bacterium]|jgi:hypothetical protein|nr:hypothetical protein [Pirellulales bacterium]
MSTLTEKHAVDEQADTRGYREISGLAVVGAIAGALSVVALDHVGLLFIPLIAVLINWRALRAIREQSPALAGRGAALAGLGLALIFGLSGVVLPYGREVANRRQAIEVASHWFEALRANQPEAAHQWSVPRWKRVKEGDSIRSQYGTASAQTVLGRFCQEPAVRTLLKLGKGSHVRYYGNVSSESTDELRTIVDVYAVTAKDAQETTSFFVQVTVIARLDKMTKAWSWELNKSEILTSPPAGLMT